MKHSFLLKFVFLQVLIVCGSLWVWGSEYLLVSPDKNVEIVVLMDKKIRYSVKYKGKQLIIPSAISIKLSDGVILGKDPVVDKVTTNEKRQILHPIVPLKNKKVIDEFREMTIHFKNKFSIIFRAYNDGVAYRFVTHIKKPIIIKNEEVTFNFNSNHRLLFPENHSFRTDAEKPYLKERLNNITFSRFSSLPTLIDFQNGIKMVLLEVDIQDYPGMYLRGNANNSLYGKFPFVAAKQTQHLDKPGWDRHIVVSETKNYIAETSGTRMFPWRAMIIVDEDGKLVESEMVCKLSPPSEIEDVSWIKPGKSAWDWWNYNNIIGVDFRAGINTQTYKYYIDFAARYKLEYIILDEGWYVQGDVMKIVPDIDMQEILSYAKKKDVGVFLWVVWKALDDQLEEALKLFQQWGVKGIKVDFMERDDQWMINTYHRISKAAAQHKLMVNYHGSSKPDGIRGRYPNVITRDLSPGLEYNKWGGKLANPETAVTFPFIRMVAGPMDYTPGAMLNATMVDYAPRYNTPMSLGTRCQQIAMFVVYESPFTVMADSPSNYYKEQECTEFITQIPTVWDMTKVLDAEVGDYIVIARKKGNDWYIGAMTDWTPRELSISLDFLEKEEYTIEIFKDGINADRNAIDYKKEVRTITSNDKLTIKMAPGGGWAARIY